eukprot:COSAG01_NODE_32672_length_577_cov_1.615063_1_plen_39_part_01
MELITRYDGQPAEVSVAAAARSGGERGGGGGLAGAGPSV